MKIVMTRAWELAKAAVVKFGGKVREYLAASLRQAWSEAKNSKKFGFVLIQKVNGMMFFGVDADVEIAYYTQEHNRFGKPYAKRHVLTPVQTGTNKETGKEAAIYRVTISDQVYDFSGKATLKVDFGRLNWVA